MCDQQSLRSACAYAQSDQSLCKSLDYSMTVKLLTEQHLEFLSLKGGCRGSSESTHVKMPHCWNSQSSYVLNVGYKFYALQKKKKKLFVAFPWVETSTGPGGFMICVFLLYDGNSRRLNRKWFYGEAGNRTCDPWFTRHSAYPLHHGGFS